jgi:hypothetical protein
MPIQRQLLPQIPSVEKFAAFLHDQGVKSKVVPIAIAKLKPVQSEINREKVEKLKADDTGDNWEAKPIIVSSDGYVLDGHHRWVAAKETDPHGKIFALVCAAPIKKLVLLGHLCGDSFTKTVDESTIYSNTPSESNLAMMIRKSLKPQY